MSSDGKQQIVLLKGWEGFGDRLQVLSHCLKYCSKFNAAICVDWRDDMWGQGEYDFKDYFELVGVPFVTLEEVLARIDAGAQYLPSTWTRAEIAAPQSKATHFDKYDLPKVFMTPEYKYLEGEILIHNSRGDRTYWTENLSQNIKFTPAVRDIVKERLSHMSIPCTVVHLRGTDRIRKDVTQKSIMDETYADFDALPPHCKARVYVVTDMKVLLDKWMKKYPQSIPVQKVCTLRDKLSDETLTGAHQQSKEVLEYYDVKKHDLNLDTLTDFVGLSFAEWSVGRSASYFITISRFIHQSGVFGIAGWLDGWMPERKGLKKEKKSSD